MTKTTIVITGSTRGIGYGMADAFLEMGCSVAVSGRSREAAEAASQKLASRYDAQRVFGFACDVSVPDQARALWDASASRFGGVDIWINNAGHSGDMGMMWELSAENAKSVVDTNVLGSIYGAQVAFNGMLKQGRGAIYNMEGMGSDGRKHAGLSFYGMTKYAIHYFTESLALEAKDTPIIVGALRPGMVITDLIRDRYKNRPEEWERVKKIFNIIAERVEVVSPWLARQVLANRRNGAIISFSSNLKLLWRFASAPFVKRNIVD